MGTLTPHLVVAGAAAAAEWYVAALGAVEEGRIPVPGGRLMQVALRFGDTTMMIADEFPEMGVVGPKSLGSPVALHLATNDVDAVWKRAVALGATSKGEPADMFWGDRFVQVVDPFGHRWNLAQHVRDVPPGEIAAAAWKAFGG